MLLPWQQGSGGHSGFPLLRGSIRLGEHRLHHHRILTWTHTHTLLLLNAWSIFVNKDKNHWTADTRCYLMSGGTVLLCCGCQCFRIAKAISINGHHWKRNKNTLLQHHVMCCVGPNTYPSSPVWRKYHAKLHFKTWQFIVTLLIS